MNAFEKNSFPLSKAYRLLEPGPVLLVTTRRGPKANVMAMSWHTMMEFEPPLFGCVISNRNYTFRMIRATKECVLAIPTAELAAMVIKVGNTSRSSTDKFQKFGLTMVPALLVVSPLIKECYANLECKVIDTSLVNKYNFFILEIVKAWVNPAIKNPRTLHHRGGGVFAVDGKIIKLPSAMK